MQLNDIVFDDSNHIKSTHHQKLRKLLTEQGKNTAVWIQSECKISTYAACNILISYWSSLYGIISCVDPYALPRHEVVCWTKGPGDVAQDLFCRNIVRELLAGLIASISFFADLSFGTNDAI